AGRPGRPFAAGVDQSPSPAALVRGPWGIRREVHAVLVRHELTVVDGDQGAGLNATMRWSMRFTLPVTTVWAAAAPASTNTSPPATMRVRANICVLPWGILSFGQWLGG